MIKRGQTVEAKSGRTYKRFDESIQVFSRVTHGLVFKSAFSLPQTEDAKDLMTDLGASGCTGDGDCHAEKAS